MRKLDSTGNDIVAPEMISNYWGANVALCPEWGEPWIYENSAKQRPSAVTFVDTP